MKRDVWRAPLAFVILACPQAADRAPAETPRETLASWMAGSFSSQEQAAADSSYYDIRLEVTPIWTHREDGYWFYVEQAVATHRDRPYRQRAYHLTADDDSTFRSEVYELPSPLRFAGAWKQPERLGGLSPDSLFLREGSAVVLRREPDGTFVGGTVGKDCASELHGATYATSEVLITADGFTSWDRGFDADGGQVWGAEQGGYIFRKVR